MGNCHPYLLMFLLGWKLEAKAKRSAIMYLQLQALKRKMTLASYIKRSRRWWVRPILQHDTLGPWATTIPLMRNEDPETFYDMFRMSPESFDRLLDLVGRHLQKYSWREPISPGERLAITLRQVLFFQSLHLIWSLLL